jgi:hypothetical protein
LDLSKAYERVDWKYLQMVLAKMGFHSKFVEWIMSCVTSVEYKVKVNGNLTKGFKPTRGITQGTLYPLTSSSLYLKASQKSFRKQPNCKNFMN